MTKGGRRESEAKSDQKRGLEKALRKRAGVLKG